MSQDRANTSDSKTLPSIRFLAGEEEATPTPRGGAVLVATLVERFGVSEIARDLEMEKHHGVSVEHILLVFLLSCTYKARSVAELQEQASKDPTLAAVMDGVKAITERVLHYFAQRQDTGTLEGLLERFVRKAQKDSRFKSRKEGILALDDSTVRKWGKHMEHITVVYDHCEKQYYLGYVVVSTCYCDKDKAYPVNFEFRVMTDKERERAEMAKLKKCAGIDFRVKDALQDWLQVLRGSNKMPRTISLVRSMVSPANFKIVDSFKVPWVAAVPERLKLKDIDGRKCWSLEDLVKRTMGNKPEELELEGHRIYTKEVSLEKYDGELDFVVVGDFAGNVLQHLLLPRASYRERVERIQDFLEHQEEPDATKLHLGVRLIRRAKEEANILAETVAVDAWYFVAWFAKALLETPGVRRVVSKLKSNQQVSIAGKTMDASALWDLAHLSFRHEKAKGFKWASTHAVVEGLGTVRLVLVRELDKKRAWREVARYIVVCTDPNWGPLQAVGAYKMRWSIEVFYRTAKQRFALAEFHSRSFAAIHFHMTMVFLAYLMTAVLRQTTPTLAGLTLGQLIDDYFGCLVRLKRQNGELLVYLGPQFAQDFGLPSP